MAIISPFADPSRRPNWPWKSGLVIDTPELSAGIRRAIADAEGTCVFEFGTESPAFELAGAVERFQPEVLFAELSAVSVTGKTALDWLAEVRRGEEMPLVVAVHATADPEEMISALRAGANEFVCLPVEAAIGEAMERIGALLESRRTASVVQGRISGILSAKGGCGATSIACHLAAALQATALQAGAAQSGKQAIKQASRVLVADFDFQAPGTHHIFRPGAEAQAGKSGSVFDSVRNLNSNSWREFVTPVAPLIDLLISPACVTATQWSRAHTTGTHGIGGRVPSTPEQWRVESLFRFVSKQYGWIMADLGRNLNPANWMFLQSTDELYIVTMPDVLALYQTRSILQMLSSRGFEKQRIRMILNRNSSSPHDFWVESIEQMFEMPVFAVIPNDFLTLNKKDRPESFEFPKDTPFGRSMMKLAARVAAQAGPGSSPLPQRQAA
jgi:pilus assembly protein CpaE